MLGNVERWWRRRLTGLLDPLRRWFEGRRARHRGLRRDLNQAHIGVTYDDYLTRVSVTAVTGGLLVAVLVFTAIETVGYLTAVAVEPQLAAAAVALAAGVFTGLATWAVGYTAPDRLADRRARRLDVMLPSVVSYMYALSHGGLDAVEIVRRVARREDTYGEQAREMGTIVNNMEYLGTDFVTALDAAADLTPSETTEEFLNDLVGVIEAGGDVEEFLAERHRQQRETLTGEQESYLERLGLFAELYVTGLVAGPLFAIILLLVIGILGSPTLSAVNVIVYAGIPLGTLLAILGLDLLSPVGQTDVRATTADEERAVPDDPAAQAYAKRKRRGERLERFRSWLSTFVREPTTSLFVTVPLAVATVAALVAGGFVDPSIAALRERPIWTTALLGVTPFLFVTVPLVWLYEWRQRVFGRFQRRFPDTLSSIARANRSGIDSVEAIEREAERSAGLIERELWRVHNDIQWFEDTSAAFQRLGDRARLAVTARTMRLLAEANRASGDLYQTLQIAADEARFQRQFLEARSREVASYVGVAIISFLVFLGIVVVIQQFYLEQVVETAAGTTGLEPGMPGSLQDIDADGFRVAFLHAVLIQSVCIGLVAGKLSRGTVLAGIKYSVGMVLVSVAVFGVI
jgi:flagellar protein FlaJ